MKGLGDIMEVMIFDMVKGDYFYNIITSAKIKTNLRMNTTKDFADFILNYLDAGKLENENIYVGFYDSDDEFIGMINAEEIDELSYDECTFDEHKAAFFMFALNAFSYVVAHNHPNGILRHSDNDISFTTIINDFFDPFGITMRDSIIVTEHGSRSIIRDAKITGFSHKYLL